MTGSLRLLGAPGDWTRGRAGAVSLVRSAGSSAAAARTRPSLSAVSAVSDCCGQFGFAAAAARTRWPLSAVSAVSDRCGQFGFAAAALRRWGSLLAANVASNSVGHAGLDTAMYLTRAFGVCGELFERVRRAAAVLCCDRSNRVVVVDGEHIERFGRHRRVLRRVCVERLCFRHGPATRQRVRRAAANDLATCSRTLLFVSAASCLKASGGQFGCSAAG